MDKSLSGRGAESRYKRPNFPMEFKRQLAEQSFEPGASVALIARQNDVNANLLFRWRHQYLDGAFGLPTVQAAVSVTESQPPALLPVSIVEDAPATTPATRPSATRIRAPNLACARLTSSMPSCAFGERYRRTCCAC